MTISKSIGIAAVRRLCSPASGGDVGTPAFKAQSFALIAVAFGLLDALLLLGWHAIDPSHTDWLKSDPTVFQAGWEFLRRSPSIFPITWVYRLNFPFGISAAYLDVIPLVAVPLRVIAPILPANFQYFGMYLTLCLVLQAYYGFRLVSRFTDQRAVIILGGLFFLNSPVLLSRLYVHFSLCSQWLILAALYYYFAPTTGRTRSRFLAPFLPLLAMAGGITPYLAAMVLSVGLAAILRSCIQSGAFKSSVPGASSTASASVPNLAKPWLDALLFGGLMLGTMGASLLLFGFLVPGAEPVFKGDGYTMFSLNLLSPFDRRHFLPGPGYEGYAYLGLGVFFLICIGLARRPTIVAKAWTPQILPLLAMCVVLTLLALSVRISVGNMTLFTLPLPYALSDLLAIFRGSGRLFWPVYYLLILFALVGAATSFPGRRSRLIVIAAALLVQFVDTASLRSAAAEQIRRAAPPSHVLVDLGQIVIHYRHLVLLPAFQCGSITTAGGDSGWPQFALLAATNNMTLNSVHAARISAASLAYNCKVLPQRVQRGELRPDSVYVLNGQLAALAMEHNANAYCRTMDGINLCRLDRAYAPHARRPARSRTAPGDAHAESGAPNASSRIGVGLQRRRPASDCSRVPDRAGGQ